MKKLTIEEKAKRYDEAIKIAKSKIKNDKDHVLYEEDIVDVFPELKGSESERIKKVLVDYFKRYRGQEERGGSTMFCGIPTDDILEWIEKQDKSAEINPDEIIEECYQDNADHIIDIVTEQEKPSEWSGEDEKIMSAIMEEGELKPSERHWLKSLKERVQSKTRKKNIEQNLAKKYGITGIGSKHVEGKLGEMTKKKIETENVDNTNKVEPKFKVGDIVQYITDSTDRRKIEEVDTLCNMYHTDSSPIMFEIEDEWKVVVNAEDVEQNPTDEGIKAEPNLKVGDWIVRKDGKNFHDNRNFARITKIDGIMCQFGNGRWLYDYEIRVWSIYDAKDGDILCWDNSNCVVMFRNIIDSESFASYGYVGSLSNRFSQESCFHEIKGVHPASTERCLRFHKAMKEVGYVWDSEKKELVPPYKHEVCSHSKKGLDYT